MLSFVFVICFLFFQRSNLFSQCLNGQCCSLCLLVFNFELSNLFFELFCMLLIFFSSNCSLLSLLQLCWWTVDMLLWASEFAGFLIDFNSSNLFFELSIVFVNKLLFEMCLRFSLIVVIDFDSCPSSCHYLVLLV